MAMQFKQSAVDGVLHLNETLKKQTGTGGTQSTQTAPGTNVSAPAGSSSAVRPSGFLTTLPAYQRALSAYTTPKISTNTLALPVASKMPTTQNVSTGALKAELADRRASGDFTMPGGVEDGIRTTISALNKRESELSSALRPQFRPLDYTGVQKDLDTSQAVDALAKELQDLQIQRDRLKRSLPSYKPEQLFNPDDYHSFSDQLAYQFERRGADLLGVVEGVADAVGVPLATAMEWIFSVGGTASTPTSELFGQWGDSLLNGSPTAEYEESIRQRYNPTQSMEEAGNFGSSVTQMLPAIGAAILTGGSSAAGSAINAASNAQRGATVGQALFGLQAAGGGMSEAAEEGANRTQAIVYGIESGLLETIVENVAGGIPFMNKGVISQAAQKVLSSPVLNKALDIAGEGGEEAVSAIITPYLKRAVYDSDAQNATADEIAESAIMGMIAAGVIQAGIELPQAISMRNAVNSEMERQYATDTEAQQTQTDPLQALAEEMAAKEAEAIFPTVEERPRPKPQKASVVSEQQQQEAAPEPSWKKYTGAPRADGTNPFAQARTAARQAAENADFTSMNTAERESFLQAYDMGRSGEGSEVAVSALPVQSDAVYGAFFQGQDDYFSGNADRYAVYRPSERVSTQAEPVDLPVQEVQQSRQTEPQPVHMPVAGQKNTASTGETGTGLVPLNEQAAARLSSGKNNVIARKVSDIISFVRNARKKKGGPERLYLGTIPDTAAQLIRSSTGIDVTGYTAILPGDSVQHIFKNHGNDATENQRGQRAVTENDIALIPQVLSEPDRVLLSHNTDVLGRTVLLFEKRIGDNYVTAQAVTDGRHALTTNSLWIQKEKDRPTTPDAGDQTSPEGNAQSALSQSPSTYSIIAQDVTTGNRQASPGGTGPVSLPIADQAPPSAPSKKKGIQIPIDERTWQDAGNRKVNAFQYDSPELHPYFVEAAKALQYDLAASVKGERLPVYDASSETGKDIIGFTGTKRSVTEPIAQALDNANLSYAQIEKALSDLIADNGQENYAAAKKVELVLDDMLTNGYTNSDGQYVPPNQEYIAARDAASGAAQDSTEYRMSEEEWNSLLTQEPDGPVMMPVVGQVNAESSVGAARYGFDPYTNLQGRYGTIPEGENPSRVVDVPAKTSDKFKVSLTARTVMEAAATPDSALPDIAQLVVDGRLSYMPISNKQRAVMAESKIRSVGYSDALANWRSDVRAGKVSADLAAMGAQLYNATVNAGDTKAAMDILYDYARLIRSGAQATQAARILKTLTPSGTLYMIQKEVNNLNEAQAGKKKRKVASADNVPVELWMQRVGENLADELSRRVNAPKDQLQTVAQTILSDLRRFASETAPKKSKAGKTRTEMDRIMDLFQNKTAYQEAWDTAKATLSDTFENDPDALAAFDSWLDQSLDYTKALTKELTNQSDIVISEELADTYLSAETEEARAQALDAIYQSIADQIPADWREKWNAWRYLSMLANPRTHIRNIAGNVGFVPLRFVKDRIAALIESGASAASGGKFQRTKSFAYNPELYAAAWRDFDNVADALSGNKYDDVQSIIGDKRTIFKFKPLEAARRGNSDLLSAEDMVFKRVSYAGALAGYLNANGVTAEQLKSGNVDSGLLDAARDYAGQEALKATFNDRNQFSDAVASIGAYKGDNKIKQVGSALVSGVLPFRRTPANILARGFEYSPLGLAKGLTYDLLQAKSGNMTYAEAFDNIAAGLTGSVLMMLGGLLAAAGIVTGGEGDDEKQAALNDLTGGQTYALNLPGGGSVTLDWLAPEALPFFMGVQAMESFGEQGLTGDTITSAFASISEPMLEMSMLQSLNDLIDNVTYSDMKVPGIVGSALISYLTQAIPTIGGQIERTAEDKRYSTYTSKDSILPTDVQYAIGKASARITGWDFQQIPYIDAWGREEATGLLPVRAFNNFLNPAYTSYTSVTPVDEEIQRLYSQIGDGAVVPSRPEKSITVDKETVYLSGDQYVEYATKKGQTAYNLLEALIQTSAYQSMSDADKAETVKDIYEYAGAVGKAAVSAYEPDGWVKNAMNSGVPADDYVLYRATADQDGNDTITQGESAAALLPIRGLTDQQKGRVWQSQNSSWSEEKNPFTGALANAGIDPETAAGILSRYSEIDKASYQGDSVARQKQTALSQYLDGLGLTDAQRTVVDDTYKFYNMFPADPIPYSIETMSDAAQARWPAAQAAGMSEEEFLKYYPIRAQSGTGITKEVKLRQLQEAGMTYQEANDFWNLTK